MHAYGLAYVVAVLAAVLITRRRWERQGGDRALVNEVALWGFPAGLLGGRLYFLATSWSEVPNHWWGPFAIWHGGLGIWGGIAGGTLAGLWVLRRRNADIPAFLDAAAPALLVAQAIGRIGNYFNQELFGGPTALPWALEVDPIHRPPGYEQYATFHPTSFYELLWNLALAAVLVRLGRRQAVRPGGLFALYVAGYSFARVGEELLRIDPAPHIFGLRLNFFMATLIFLAGIAWFVWGEQQTRRRPKPRARTGALLAAGGLACLTGCGHGEAVRPHAVRDAFPNNAFASTRHSAGLGALGPARPASSDIRPSASRPDGAFEGERSLRSAKSGDDTTSRVEDEGRG